MRIRLKKKKQPSKFIDTTVDSTDVINSNMVSLLRTRQDRASRGQASIPVCPHSMLFPLTFPQPCSWTCSSLNCQVMPVAPAFPSGRVTSTDCSISGHSQCHSLSLHYTSFLAVIIIHQCITDLCSNWFILGPLLHILPL